VPSATSGSASRVERRAERLLRGITMNNREDDALESAVARTHDIAQPAASLGI
jgi:hypothetical protein